jgi:glycosyltransferase involved in cell wall biosynthesis
VHIGIAAPLATKDIADLLGDHAGAAPPGYIGAPLVATLIRALLKRGHQISAVTTDTSLPVNRPDAVSVRSDNLTVHYVPQRKSAFMLRDGTWGRAWDFFALERNALVRAIKLSTPDIVHAHWSYEFAWSAIDSGIPHLITAHDSPLHVLKQSWSAYRAVRYAMARHVFKRAKAISAVSPFVREAIQPWVEKPVHVVGNPLSTNKDPTRHSRDLCPRSSPVISMVINGWQGLKNPENAFRAFRLLRRRIPSASLHAYGNDFGKGGKAEFWCHNNGLLEGCHFHGYLSFQELQLAIADSDILLHTSRLESCPMGILEAMSIGIPIVGGRRSGGVPWVVGDAGLLTDIENPQMIADSMHRLLTDSALHKKCVGFAISRSQIDFGEDAITNAYETLYSEVLSQFDSKKQRNSV